MNRARLSPMVISTHPILHRTGRNCEIGGIVSHLQFWGKTFGAADQPIGNSQTTYKPVLHHLLDVSAVALVFLRDQPARLAREAQLVSMEPDAYANLMAFLAGLHDLGKFTRNFQAKRADLWPTALGTYPGSSIAGPPHWRATPDAGRAGTQFVIDDDVAACVDLNFNPGFFCKNRKFERLPDYRDAVTPLDVGGSVLHHRNRTASVPPWCDAKTRNPSRLLRNSWSDK